MDYRCNVRGVWIDGIWLDGVMDFDGVMHFDDLWINGIGLGSVQNVLVCINGVGRLEWRCSLRVVGPTVRLKSTHIFPMAHTHTYIHTHTHTCVFSTKKRAHIRTYIHTRV